MNIVKIQPSLRTTPTTSLTTGTTESTSSSTTETPTTTSTTETTTSTTSGTTPTTSLTTGTTESTTSSTTEITPSTSGTTTTSETTPTTETTTSTTSGTTPTTSLTTGSTESTTGSTTETTTSTSGTTTITTPETTATTSSTEATTSTKPGCTDYSGNFRNNGDEWSDQNNTCIYYRCSGDMVIETEITCFYNSTCDEIDKKWDDRHCCYYCPQRVTQCKVQPKSLTIIKDNCTATVELNSCQGNCKSFSMFDYTIGKMKHNCECCEEQTTETKEVTLACGNGSSKQYSYISAKTCQCSICENSAP
ncbi:integumentary mucin C.1-like [Leucoraja erinacea]|uniref:integumentary mucin C.1-like n=1 Tax=Leucoraja erinaceus TaxID=7782 RepID=UPI0024562BF5|nr:integumentary mucin C.1-like [Leucoraja erinacea]